MAKSVLGPMIKAVSDALLASTDLDDVLGGADRVFVANPPDEVSPPYVVVADVDSVPQRVLGGLPAYHDGSVTLEVYSSGSSPLVVTQAAEVIASVLDEAVLPLDGFDSVFCLLAQERRDPLPPGEERATVPFTFKVRRQS